MKYITIIFLFIFLNSCKSQEKDDKYNKKDFKIPKNRISPYSLEKKSPYLRLPLESADSLNVSVKKLICKYDKNLITFPLGSTSNFGNQFDRRVYTHLFPIKNITKGLGYTTKSKETNNITVFDLYYSSKMETKKTFVNLKLKLTVNKFDKGCIEYFKPCGKYFLLKNNRITILESINCYKYYLLDNFIKINKNEFEEILYISVDFIENKDVVHYNVFK